MTEVESLSTLLGEGRGGLDTSVDDRVRGGQVGLAEGDRGGIGGGQDDLFHGRDRLGGSFAARRIEFAEDVVEEEDGRVGGLVGEVIGLGQAQAQGGGALLRAGGEVGGRPAVEIDEQVVSVGADGGGATGQVAGFRLAQGLRVGGLVSEAQRLGGIVGRAQSEMSGGGEIGEGAGGLGARLPDWLGGGLEQLVPLLQLGVEGAALGDALEQGVALRQCALVAAEIGRVGALPLSDGDVEVASAEGRGTGEQVEIEGSELDGADRAEGLGGSAGDAVDANPLAGQGSAGSLSGGAGSAGGAGGAGGERDFDLERLGVDDGLAGDAHDLGWSASQRISSPSVWARVERREASM